MLTALMDNAGRSSTSSRRARLVGKGTASMEEVNANMAMVENEVYIIYIYVYIYLICLLRVRNGLGIFI